MSCLIVNPVCVANIRNLKLYPACLVFLTNWIDSLILNFQTKFLTILVFNSKFYRDIKSIMHGLILNKCCSSSSLSLWELHDLYNCLCLLFSSFFMLSKEEKYILRRSRLYSLYLPGKFKPLHCISLISLFFSTSLRVCLIC